MKLAGSLPRPWSGYDAGGVMANVSRVDGGGDRLQALLASLEGR
jgi:hypothetical protein